jgi:hypothetical protein
MDAAIAWVGILPAAINGPPASRVADANGAVQEFSQTTTPATLSFSIASARCTTSGQDLGDLGLQAEQLAHLVLGEVVELERLDGAVGVLVHDQQVEHADGPGLDEQGELGRDPT